MGGGGGGWKGSDFGSRTRACADFAPLLLRGGADGDWDGDGVCGCFGGGDDGTTGCSFELPPEGLLDEGAGPLGGVAGGGTEGGIMSPFFALFAPTSLPPCPTCPSRPCPSCPCPCPGADGD